MSCPPPGPRTNRRPSSAVCDAGSSSKECRVRHLVRVPIDVHLAIRRLIREVRDSRQRPIQIGAADQAGWASKDCRALPAVAIAASAASGP